MTSTVSATTSGKPETEKSADKGKPAEATLESKSKPKKQKKFNALVWRHFNYMSGILSVCKVCRCDVTTNLNTSGLIAHLKHNHKILYATLIVDMRNKKAAKTKVDEIEDDDDDDDIREIAADEEHPEKDSDVDAFSKCSEAEEKSLVPQKRSSSLGNPTLDNFFIVTKAETTKRSKPSSESSPIIPSLFVRQNQIKAGGLLNRKISMHLLQLLCQNGAGFSSALESNGLINIFEASLHGFQRPTAKELADMCCSKFDSIFEHVKALLKNLEYYWLEVHFPESPIIQVDGKYPALMTLNFIDTVSISQENILLGHCNFTDSKPSEYYIQKFFNAQISLWSLDVKKIAAVIVNSSHHTIVDCAKKLFPTSIISRPVINELLNFDTKIEDGASLQQSVVKLHKFLETVVMDSIKCEALDSALLDGSGMDSLKLMNMNTLDLVNHVLKLQGNFQNVYFNPCMENVQADFPTLSDFAAFRDVKALQDCHADLMKEMKPMISSKPVVTSVGLVNYRILASELEDVAMESQQGIDLRQQLHEECLRVENNMKRQDVVGCILFDPRYKTRPFVTDSIAEEHLQINNEISQKNDGIMQKEKAEEEKHKSQETKTSEVKEDKFDKMCKKGKPKTNTKTDKDLLAKKLKAYMDEKCIQKMDCPIQFWKARTDSFPVIHKVALKYLMNSGLVYDKMKLYLCCFVNMSDCDFFDKYVFLAMMSNYFWKL